MADYYGEDQQLRQELQKFDVTVGKITDKNRDILVKKLNHLRARQRAAEAPPSPSRRSPRRGKKSPPRRSQAPPAAFNFSSSDEDDLASRAAESATQRQKNLRRRTVDSGSIPDEVDARDRTATANAEPAAAASAGKSKRRSFGATTNSPFLAGSLRNPALSQSVTEGGPRRRSGRVNNDVSYDGGEISDSDQELVEMRSSGVNTTPSLQNVADRSPLMAGDLRGQQGKSRLQTGGASGRNNISISQNLSCTANDYAVGYLFFRVAESQSKQY